MRRFFIYTNAHESLLDIENRLLKQYNIQPYEEYAIDVFNDEDILIATLYKDNQKH
jgi:hypothetical protein